MTGYLPGQVALLLSLGCTEREVDGVMNRLRGIKPAEKPSEVIAQVRTAMIDERASRE